MNKTLKTAFTLIELLVVIAIIGVLSGLIIVGMSSATQSATIAKAQIFSSSLKDSLLMNLVSEWRFDGSGIADGSNATTAYTQDTWGISNCSITGTPLVYSGSDCVYGSCLEFNGTTDYLNCGNSANLNFTTALTIEGWVKTNQLYTNVWRNVIGKNLYSIYSIFVEWSASGGSLKFEIDSSARYIVSGPDFAGNVDKWMYVVGTYSSAEGMLKIYYNGNLYNTSSIGAGRNINTNTNPILLGGYPNNYFNGTLDGIRLYGAAIPASQIKEQYYIGLNHLLSKDGIGMMEYKQRLFNN